MDNDTMKAGRNLKYSGTALLANVRDELRARRNLRAARKALAIDLAGYTTEADLAELEAILGRAHEDPADVAELRRIVSRKRAA